MKKAVLATMVAGLVSMNSANAASFTIEMIADNDFAIFSGTNSGINNLLYQNNHSWYQQLPNLTTQTFDLAAGDDTFYVLGMGGGGQENISGKVNGVNMTDSSVSVSMSSNIAGSLTGYNGHAVANGFYNALLGDVQTAFASATWSNAASNVVSNEVVIQQGGFGSGFRFDHMTAHLFSFDAGDVNVPTTSVSEPSSLAILGLGIVGLGLRSRKKKS